MSHIHWATTRRPEPATLKALAIDHRAQLEAMADRLGAPRARIAAFKRLAVQAAARVANGADGYGVLLDGEHGREALFDAAETDLWIGRPVELPGSRPLAFESRPTSARTSSNGRSTRRSSACASTIPTTRRS